MEARAGDPLATILIMDEGTDAGRRLQDALRGEAVACVALEADLPALLEERDPRVIALCCQADPTEAVLWTARVSAAAPEVPLLVVTADEDTALACLDHGAKDCLLLPFHDRVARARVNGLIGAQDARSSAREVSRKLAQRSKALETTVDALERSGRAIEDAQRRQRYLATHDGLTGLPNRTLFQDFAGKTLAFARRHHQTLAVITVDLDSFKAINQARSQAVGDELLCSVAGRIGDCVRGSDMVARLAGDEFAILLGNLNVRDDAAVVAEKIVEAISRPHRIEGEDVFLTPSLGIALYPDDGDNPETLMSHAEIALKRAKDDGRGNHRFYSRQLEGRAFERTRLEFHLRGALARREFQLYFQPQVDSSKGQMIGAEALLRWIHPELGFVSPGEFIPVAENAGMIDAIGAWVIGEACRWKKRWEDRGMGGFPVSVNVSFRQLKAAGLENVVAEALERTGLEASHLDIEITENSIMDDLDIALVTLNRLEEMGVGLSIDDFGTGYSSLSVLGQLPAHTLKIDRAFVKDIDDNSANAAITRAVVAVAHELGLKTIAEGVETPEELEVLRRFGVTQMQGYLFGAPVPAEQFETDWNDGLDFELN